MEILTTNSEIQDKIRWVLGDHRDKRIVLVAFVGKEPERYIDRPEGIDLYCWLKIPGTNPNGLRSLLGKANLFAVKNLHTKIYWSRKRGSVVGSANLSQEALEDGNQYELAVYLPPGKLDVRPLLKRFIANPIDKLTVDRFEERYNIYRLRNPNEMKGRNTSRHRTTSRSFLEWCESKGPAWNLYWWGKLAYPPEDAVDAIEREKGSRYYHDYICSDSRNHYRLGEWVLSFKEGQYTNGDIRPLSLSWFIPEVYGITRSKEWSDYPHLWFQVGTELPQPPFNLRDGIFRKVLTRAIIQLGGDVENVVKQGTRPTERFLHTLEERYLELTLT